jgi:hypothetical protein
VNVTGRLTLLKLVVTLMYVLKPTDYIRLALTAIFIVVLVVVGIRTGIGDLIVRVKLRKYRSRFAPGHCAGCGYDMRASPERCPECGRAQAILKPPPKKLL